MLKTVELVKRIIRRSGYDLIPSAKADELYFAGVIPYLTAEEKRILDTCLPYTQTGRERLFSLIRATQYVVRSKIPGAFVECGVWKGGSIMAIALTLAPLLQTSADLYLFDTFKGMPSSTPVDVDLEGNDESWYRQQSDPIMHNGRGDQWNAASLTEVKQNLASINSGHIKFHFVEGRVEETIPKQAPESIALLRLDTDFYESTKHEMAHLFPRISKGGVIIIDDYGHFLGARKAVDEYLQENNVRILLNRIDYTGVIGVKTE